MGDDKGLQKAWRNVKLYTAAIFITSIILVVSGSWQLALVLVGIWLFFVIYFIFHI